MGTSPRVPVRRRSTQRKGRAGPFGRSLRTRLSLVHVSVRSTPFFFFTSTQAVTRGITLVTLISRSLTNPPFGPRVQATRLFQNSERVALNFESRRLACRASDDRARATSPRSVGRTRLSLVCVLDRSDRIYTRDPLECVEKDHRESIRPFDV